MKSFRLSREPGRHLFRLIIMLVVVFVIAGCMSEQQKDREIMNKVVMGQYDEAERLVRKYYQNDRSKAMAWFTSFQVLESKLYIDKLVIQKGWKYTINGNYSYVRGRIKNTGDKTISYFKIKALYKNKNNDVLDTGYTNSANILVPGGAKKFEIMHKRSPDYKYVSIHVEKVSVE